MSFLDSRRRAASISFLILENDFLYFASGFSVLRNKMLWCRMITVSRKNEIRSKKDEDI